MKRIYKSLIICMCLFVIMSPTSFSVSGDETAQKLYELNLLKGDSGGFNLNGQLKRSEAATFIVKLLGQENEVLGNKAKYLTQDFNDVKASDWFAPFVGYCKKEGIVNGFPDGTFKPNQYVSEKAFLTMVLGAMSYEAGPDFHWDNVNQVAYDKGLVQDITYAVKSDDNTSYLRRDVVSVLFNSLNKNIKQTNQTMIDRLVDRKVTNLYIAKKYNLIRLDDVELLLTEARLIDNTTLEITFNEKLDDLKKGQILVLADGDELNVKGIEYADLTASIKLDSELYNDRSYSVKISDLEDTQGNATEMLSKSFSGLEKTIVKSDLFKIAAATAVSNKHIDIKFTHPIDDTSEQVLLYQFGYEGSALSDGGFKNLSAEKVQSDTVRLELLNNELIDKKPFTVFVRGDLASSYGLNLNNGSGEEVTIVPSNLSLDAFEVSSINPVDSKVIEIFYSRPLDSNSGFEKNNYRLRDLKHNTTKIPNGVYYFKDEDGERRDRIILTYPTLRTDVEYELEIRGVKDEFRSDTADIYRERFEITDLEDVRPELIDVNPINRTMISLRFNYPLNEESEKAAVRINENMSVAGKRVREDDPYVLDVYFVKNRYLKNDKEYTVEVRNGLKDYLMRSPKTTLKDEFYGTDEVRSALSIDEAKYIDSSTIQIRFNEAFRISEAQSKNNYAFLYESGKVKRTFFPYDVKIVNDKTVILKTDTEFGQGTIEVVIDKLYEYSGQYSYTKLSSKVTRWAN